MKGGKFSVIAVLLRVFSSFLRSVPRSGKNEKNAFGYTPSHLALTCKFPLSGCVMSLIMVKTLSRGELSFRRVIGKLNISKTRVALQGGAKRRSIALHFRGIRNLLFRHGTRARHLYPCGEMGSCHWSLVGCDSGSWSDVPLDFPNASLGAAGQLLQNTAEYFFLGQH